MNVLRKPSTCPPIKEEITSFRVFEMEGTVDEFIKWLEEVKASSPGYDEYRIELTEFADIQIVGIIQ